MISAVITCAGNHTRFGKNKLLEDLAGKPVFIRTIERFINSKKIKEIIVPVRKEYFSIYKKILKKEGLKVKLVIGGSKRYVSAYNGVKICKNNNILIHDGARPLVSSKLVDKVAQEILKTEAVITALRPFTCIKKGKSFLVEECLARSETWVAQTPQAFKKPVILTAYRKALKNKNLKGMDDCELVSSLGVSVKVVPGEANNIKITLPSDLIIANSLYQLTKS